MKKYNNTEELDELLGGELDLDLAWSEFSKEKKKTRRIPFWWFFGVGALLFLGIAGYFGDFINLKTENQESVVSNSSSLIVVPSSEEVPLSISEQQSITQIEQTEIINSSSLTTSSILPTITLGRNEQKIAPSFKNDHLLNFKNSVNIKSKSLGNVKTTPITQLERKTAFNENSNFLSTTLVAESIENQTVNSDTQNENTILEVPPVATLTFNLSYQKAEKILIFHETHHASSTKQWSIGLNYIIANAHRNLSSGQAAYTQRRQEEQFLEVNKLELLLSKQFATPFFFQTGMTLTQYRSKLVEHIQTTTSPVWYENVVTETHTQNNFTKEIIGTAQGSQLEINRYTRFQKYQTLSIPLRLGLRFPTHQHWQIAVSSGISFSVFNQTEGATFASGLPDGVYVPLEQLEYRTIGLLEGTGQVAIERSFGKTNLSLGLQGTWDLNNRFSNTTLGVDKFRHYGIHFGIRRIF